MTNCPYFIWKKLCSSIPDKDNLCIPHLEKLSLCPIDNIFAFTTYIQFVYILCKQIVYNKYRKNIISIPNIDRNSFHITRRKLVYTLYRQNIPVDI